MNTKKRIEWVDVVKGMLIPLVIIGHTAQSATIITYVYSFHMPLFFILSGYTAKPADNLKTYVKHIWKNFIHLMLPCILVQLFIVAVEYWTKVGAIQMLPIARIEGVFYKLYWGCAWGWASGSPSVGMLWFFITMFWAKVIWEGIVLVFPKKNTAVCVLVSLIGILIGFEKYVPQNLDIAMMVVIYYCIGNLLRKYQDTELFRKFKKPAFWFALAFWIHYAQQGIYVELAIEKYAGITVGILESLCASYVFCILGQEAAERKILKNVFSFLGKHTLLIVLVHHADSLLQQYWQQDTWQMSFIYRSVVVLGISCAIVLIRYIFSKGLSKVKGKKYENH